MTLCYLAAVLTNCSSMKSVIWFTRLLGAPLSAWNNTFLLTQNLDHHACRDVLQWYKHLQTLNLSSHILLHSLYQHISNKGVAGA